MAVSEKRIQQLAKDLVTALAQCEVQILVHPAMFQIAAMHIRQAVMEERHTGECEHDGDQVCPECDDSLRAYEDLKQQLKAQLDAIQQKR